MTRAVALVAAAWLVVGLTGAWGYAHRYADYRGFTPPRAPPGTPLGVTRQVRYWSPALHARSELLVHLPAGYPRGGPYPVLYVLHGHPGKAADILRAGAIGTDLDALVAQRRVRPMILVLPEVTTGPEAGGDTEWADTTYGRYDAAVADVVHAVDKRFATRRDRAGRVLAGLSSGAYGAANVTLHHLGLFGGLESWSGYFVQSKSGVFAGASRAGLAANSPLLYVRRVAGRIHRLGLHAYVYVGAQDHLARVVQLPAFVDALRATGAQVETSIFPGRHDWALWRREMPHALEVASGWFSGSSAAPAG
jgi:enterochelin esterase-like enzyme